MNDKYISPLSKRYAGEEMQRLFSKDKKFKTWRRLWIALAESQMELGLNISREQIQQMKDNMDNIDYQVAEAKEKEIRHDVMSHIYAFGKQCPDAKGIIHLGATSCFVGDNTDLVLMKEGLVLVRKKLINTIKLLSDFAMEYRDLPTLGFTHFQPAQPTTVGKRASLWIQDLLLDLEALEFVISTLKLRGAKGTTGTQASFMELFDGDGEKVKELDQKIAEKLDFSGTYHVTGQTYSRKVDFQVLQVLSGIAQSAYKFSNDIRLLAHMKEIEEPFEKSQVGSSAMAYKRNPMRSERMASIARFIISNSINPALNTTGQWLERTLDDSANRRLSIPEGFLATDGLLSLYINVADGLVVYPKVIEKHLQEELPFMATETILMEGVKRGGDRQVLHEAIRKHSLATAESIKVHGQENNLVERLGEDPEFNMTEDEIRDMIRPERFVGRSVQQVEEFVGGPVKDMLERYPEDLGIEVNISV
ncbi:adenylosuccinate lyase [Gudongella sp. SC589]|uniref:adenylosuccinate lyase n=1 Tax=Gudongella sp. SC589 TaxID=3385990 RepID=UPI00390477C9